MHLCKRVLLGTVVLGFRAWGSSMVMMLWLLSTEMVKIDTRDGRFSERIEELTVHIYLV